MLTLTQQIARWAQVIDDQWNGEMNRQSRIISEGTRYDGIPYYEKVALAHGDAAFGTENRRFWERNADQLKGMDETLVDACWYVMRLAGVREPSWDHVMMVHNSVSHIRF